MPDFSLIERKVERAREHFDALKSAVDTLEMEFARDGVVADSDPQGGFYVWRVQIDDTRLTPLACMLGDFMHNLRASLDYLVWGLASEEHRTERPLPEFPIFSKPEGFQVSGIRKIRSLPEEAKGLIERVQPYQHPAWDGYTSGGPGVRAGSPLAIVQALDNIDKHRTPLVTAWWVRGHHATGPEEALNALVVLSGSRQNGGVVARLPVASGYTPENVNFRSSFVISMGEEGWSGISVVIFASNLYHRIGRELIPAFKPFFA